MKIQDVDPPEYDLMVLNSQIRSMMDAVLRPHGLKLVEWRLLQCLADEGVCSICDLAQLAVVERTKTSRLVDKLIQRQLIAKEQLPGDRRYAHVRLCEEGRKVLDACSDDVVIARTRLFDGLDQEEISNLLAILRKMQQNSRGPFRKGHRATTGSQKRA
ncbi:MAG: MarR family transcriptional regulator [Rhodobacteraceae bacterium]|jgi:DNA-binding MarR family transcriptional regulator|nr:MarR family transcriptional regulator [Paracoccaceae bacterium]